MIDLYLRAATEEELIDALPMFRVDDDWLDSSEHHALDAGFVVYSDPNAEEPIAIEGYNLNLRLSKQHPEYTAIIEATSPFVVEPEEHRQRFAPARMEVPNEISDRQFAQIMAIDGVITQDAAIAWAARGELPAMLEESLLAIPEEGGQRFNAKIVLSSAKIYERDHPLVPMLGALLGYDDAALDDVWQRGARLR